MTEILLSITIQNVFLQAPNFARTSEHYEVSQSCHRGEKTLTSRNPREHHDGSTSLSRDSPVATERSRPLN
jgi:hypothetical protein